MRRAVARCAVLVAALSPLLIVGSLVGEKGYPPSPQTRHEFSDATATSVPFTILGAGLFPQRTRLAAGSSRTVNVDAVTTTGFDPDFYRQLVSNGFEAPTQLQPLRRWTRSPSIYLKTVDEAGEPIDGPTLDMIETTVRDAVTQWTRGQLTTTITRGTGTREGISGWITVKFPAMNPLLQGYCGRAPVGVDGGWIEFGYHVAPTRAGACHVPGYVIAPHTVRHEVGHALGFWHTDRVTDLMWGGVWTDGNQQPSTRELAAAAIAYARPSGNGDPDVDPSSAVSLAQPPVR